jgi:PAS domain S-box-containing protein
VSVSTSDEWGPRGITVSELNPVVYERAFGSVGIPAILIDTDGRVVDSNRAGLDFIGYDRAELVGSAASRIVAEKTTMDAITATIADGDVWRGDIEVRTAEGRTVYGQGSVAPIPDYTDGEDGGSDESKVCGYVAAFVDARQKRQFETAAEVLNRLLRHDLKNDLNVVYGYIQQARTQTTDENVLDRLGEARETLSDVIHKSERARDLRELLDRAYEESTYPVRLDEVLSETVADVSGEYDHAEFRLGDVPSVQVAADDLLATVLEGVLENAVQHNDGDPRVAVGVETTPTTAVVQIADNGPGMPADDSDVVFGRGATDALTHGDGISLFFADSVVRTYEGQIRFEERTNPLATVADVEESVTATGETAKNTDDPGGTVFEIELTLA